MAEQENPEYKAFASMTETLTALLELSVEDFASNLWSRSIITDNVYHQIFDRDYDGSDKRASLFFWYMIKIIEFAETQHPDHAKGKEIIEKLSAIVRDTDSSCALKDAAKEIGNFVQ